jgi:tRNA-modifying protein YgfZ
MSQSQALTIETPLTEEHRAAGASFYEFENCVLPGAFRGYEREYRAAREAVALFDTNWHAIAALSGRDRVQYLHAITSNDIKSLADGRGTLALLLNPQGRILAELEVYARQETLLVLTHASRRESTVGTLRKYVIGSKVVIEDLSEQMGSFAVEGPRAARVIEEACGVPVTGLAERSIQEVTIDGVSCWLVKKSQFGEIGAEVFAGRDSLTALWQKLLAEVRAQGGEPIGMAALNSLRLEAGQPWFPADFSDSTIPHEAALETTHINFNKGCYTGQEIVERVRSRGHVNRKRVLLRFSTAAPPPPGTKLRSGDAEIGSVTSGAYSPRASVAIGMGYVRREQFAPGSVVEFDGGTAEVQANPK